MTSLPKSSRNLTLSLLLAAVLIAVFVSYFASSKPDGLEKVAGDQGITAAEQPHATGDGPLADYQTSGVDQPLLSGGLAGLIGVCAVGAIGTGLFMGLRRRSAPADDPNAALPS